MAFSLPIRWRRITRGSAASRDVFLIPKISHIIRHCKFVLQGACIFLKKKKNSKRHVKLEQKTRRRKNLSLNRFFHKLDNNKWKIHTGARAREQKYISIYISLFMKTFLKMGIYIYIYICIYIPDCKIILAFFVLYFHLLLIRSYRIQSFFFVSWSLLQKIEFPAVEDCSLEN